MNLAHDWFTFITVVILVLQLLLYTTGDNSASLFYLSVPGPSLDAQTGSRTLLRVVAQQETMESLKVVSMNVNGLNMNAKRRIIFDHLRQSKADIALLQETHATSTIENIWEKEWGGGAQPFSIMEPEAPEE